MRCHDLAAAARAAGYTADDLPADLYDLSDRARWRALADSVNVDVPGWAGRCNVRDLLAVEAVR